MKYIDADKLIAEIRRIVEEIPINHGVADTVNKLLSSITSLQQEQPETIGGVVHHALNVHWLVVNKKKLSARLKQFPEGTEVEILINARKEGAK